MLSLRDGTRAGAVEPLLPWPCTSPVLHFRASPRWLVVFRSGQRCQPCFAYGPFGVAFGMVCGSSNDLCCFDAGHGI
ncbi:hypothetical protein Bca4012_093865 [Brassica carinata]